MAMIKCEECGQEYSDKADKCTRCGCPNPAFERDIVRLVPKGKWSTGRLVIGILSLVLFVLVAVQSCAAGVGNALQNQSSASGAMGFFLAFMMLIAGIIAICTRNSRSKIVTMLPTVFYWIGSLVTVGNSGIYKDLPIWGGLAFIFGLVFVFAGIKTKKN